MKLIGSLILTLLCLMGATVVMSFILAILGCITIAPFALLVLMLKALGVGA